MLNLDEPMAKDLVLLTTIFAREECVLAINDLVSRYGPEMCRAALRAGWVKPLPVPLWPDQKANDHILGLLGLPG